MPQPTATSPIWLGAALGIGAAVGAAVMLLARRWLRRWRLRRRFARGRRAEIEAAALLQRSGYRVLAEQVERAYELRVAGQVTSVRLRADLLAERRGRCYLVEVKTGKAAEPTATDTRRQLLEYCHAFPEVDGLLLADMQRRRVLTVDFGGQQDRVWRRLWSSLLLLTVGAGAGAGAALLLSALP